MNDHADDFRTRAQRGEIAAMLWCSRNLREPKDRSFWWFKAIETAHSGSSDFDVFAMAYARWERWYEDMDPYRNKASAPLDDHVAAWLARTCGVSFAQMKSCLAPDRWEDEEYRVLPEGSLRERLFDYRGLLVLAALADCDLRGCEVLKLLKRISSGNFDSEVFRRDDPTWKKVAGFVIERWTDS